MRFLQKSTDCRQLCLSLGSVAINRGKTGLHIVVVPLVLVLTYRSDGMIQICASSSTASDSSAPSPSRNAARPWPSGTAAACLRQV